MRYHLELTGYVGGYEFNSRKTDSLLNQYPGKPVDVLIDSTGGSLAHGLSIAAAFRNHGEVSAHLRGMSASAATIAAMGAKHISIEPDGLFLVHKVMMSFFDWSTHNADTLQKYIEALTEQKKDLETLDASVAATYAARCKKPVNELLDLMKEGKWLSAQQAMDWGFVDEIKGNASNQRAKLTRSQANAFAAQGLPLPPLEIEEEPASLFSEFFKSLKSFFSMDPKNQKPEPPAQEPKNESPASAPVDEKAALQAEIEALKSEKQNMQAQLDALNKKPGDTTSSAVSNPEPAKEPEAKDEFSEFMATAKSARELYDSLP